MGAVLVVVANVFAEKPLQVPLVEHDHMVEQIPAAAFDPPFGDSVLPRASKRSSLGFASHCSDGSNHIQAKLLVAVKDQVFVGGLEWKGLTQLLHNPVA